MASQRSSTITVTLLILEKRAFSVQEFHALKAIPPELEWYANFRREKD